MKRKEFEERNLLSRITDCFKESAVSLKCKDGKTRPFYLVDVSMTSRLRDDFSKTYPDAEKRFGEDAIDAVIGPRNTWIGPDMIDRFTEHYRLLLNTDLEPDFAFNSHFAEIDLKNKRIVFKNPEEILQDREYLKERARGCKEPMSDAPLRIQGGGAIPLGRLMNLAGDEIHKAAPSPEERNYRMRSGRIKPQVLHDHPSLLSEIEEHTYSFSRVNLMLNGKPVPFIALNATASTSTLGDFRETYKKEIKEIRANYNYLTNAVLCETAPEIIFGCEKSDNRYILLLSKNLRIVHAFNAEFAKFENIEDGNAGEIIYTPLNELLEASFKKNVQPGIDKAIANGEREIKEYKGQKQKAMRDFEKEPPMIFD